MSSSQVGVTLKSDYSRIISETGDINIASISVANRSTKYFSDICTTLIDIQWRWNLLLFFGGFTFTWVSFAAFYYLLSYVHGDQFEQDDDWLPCVENVHDYASAFLFSIETMSTIGYGYRFVTEACPGAYVGVIAQSVLGAALQFALAGLVVAKVRRAKKRRTTILLSKVACIYAEDLKLRLAIRIGDMRKSDIIGAHANAYFIQKSFSKTGDKIPVQYYNMDFRSEGGYSKLFLPWPTYIIHNINEDSPLYNLSRDDAMSENFELIVELQAVSSSLSQSFKVRKSYHPWEIKWGHRFLSLGHTYEDLFDENIVDYENFHETKPVTTPMVSAKDIDEMSLKGDLSPEKLQKRRDSRVETNLYDFMKRRKSVTDTFLGAEAELSVSDLSMTSDTMSIDRLRRISATTYHGPGTMDRRKSFGNIFGPPVSGNKLRRHSTGQFLVPDVFVRTRRNSREGPLVGNVAYHLEKDKSYHPWVLDIKSDTHEDSGPRYVRNKKRVTLNPNPITGPLRKISDPGVPSAPLCSALTKRRRHSAWQFAEQDSFIKDYKRLNPETYLGPHLEVVESEESDQQDSSHGGDVQEAHSLEDDTNKALDAEEGSECREDTKGNLDETEYMTGRRVVFGSFKKKYTMQQVPKIIIHGVVEDDTTEEETSHDQMALERDNRQTVQSSQYGDHTTDERVHKESAGSSYTCEQTTDVREERASPDSSYNGDETTNAREHRDSLDSSQNGDQTSHKRGHKESLDSSYNDEQTTEVREHRESLSSSYNGDQAGDRLSVEQINPAFMYDSEDDIGYSRNIVDSDDEDSATRHSRVNQGYESDKSGHGD